MEGERRLCEMKQQKDESDMKVINAVADLKVCNAKLSETQAHLERAEGMMAAEMKLRVMCEEAALKEVARLSAILSNRCILECALFKLDAKNGHRNPRSMRAQYYDFLNSKIMAGKWKTDPWCVESKSFHDQINGCSSVSASEQDVKNELSDLPHTLSSPVHYSIKPIMIGGARGLCIGGALSPFNNALGICMAILIKEGCCTDTVFLVNEQYETFAKIDDTGIGGYNIPCFLACHSCSVCVRLIILSLLQSA
jgi:hypothetical protein